jgi:hypothetical protein
MRVQQRRFNIWRAVPAENAARVVTASRPAARFGRYDVSAPLTFRLTGSTFYVDLLLGELNGQWIASADLAAYRRLTGR